MYRIAYGFLYVFSLLPLEVLYLFSDLAYVVIYHLIGYRKEIVRNNIAIAFPSKSKEARLVIEKRFYKNFTDSFIETIKAFSASEEFIRKRFAGNFHVVNELFDKGYQKVQMHSGHNFNWEFANLSLPLNLKPMVLTVYMPITNKGFDKIFYKMRAKTGAKMLSAVNVRNEILPYRNETYAIALVADQNPVDPRRAFWISFFNRPTPFLKAPENGARRGNLPVVFAYFRKEKRGYYTVHFEVAEEKSGATKPGELTKRYANFLQKSIEQQPENWLWSHRRWKWEWKEEYGPVIQ